MPLTYTKTGSLVWRDFNTDGVPASGKKRVDKADVRTWAGEVEAHLNSIWDDDGLSAVRGMTLAANKGIYATGSAALATYDLTAYGRTLGGVADAGAARTALGVTIGADVQAYDATLQSIAALGTAAGRGLYTTGVNTWAEFVISAAGRALLDDANAAAQRTTLGLGTAALLADSTNATLSVDPNAAARRGLVANAINAATTAVADAMPIRARACVNGTLATPTLTGNVNISGVTKNGTGDYTLSLANAMANTSYQPIISVAENGGDGRCFMTYEKGTSNLRIRLEGATGAAIDFDFSVVVFGELA